MLESTSLFGRPAGETGEYDARVHLAQMVSLLGPPPLKLVMRERVFRQVKVNAEVYNARGQGFRNMCKFWGEPCFNNENGKVVQKVWYYLWDNVDTIYCRSDTSNGPGQRRPRTARHHNGANG